MKHIPINNVEDVIYHVPYTWPLHFILIIVLSVACVRSYVNTVAHFLLLNPQELLFNTTITQTCLHSLKIKDFAAILFSFRSLVSTPAFLNGYLIRKLLLEILSGCVFMPLTDQRSLDTRIIST